jgi:hypothetical protein
MRQLEADSKVMVVLRTDSKASRELWVMLGEGIQGTILRDEDG